MKTYEMELRIAALLENKKYKEAYDLLVPLAGEESEYALLALGWMHENGVFVGIDLGLAQSYYRHAAALGSLEAHLRLGLLLNDAGQKVEARTILEKGAEMGNLGCMNEFGAMLFEGEGGPADVKTGIAWLERAANQGHFFARRKLLSIMSRNSRSFLTKIFVFSRIIALSVKAGVESLRNSNSEKL
jgi:TPR repeat protein